MRSDHTRLDERSLALHKLVAERLAADPTLVDTALENLRRWQSNARSGALAEWEAILSGPLDELISLLKERSQRATRLRQSSPFAGVLSEAERRAVYESYAAGAHHSGGQRDFR